MTSRMKSFIKSDQHIIGVSVTILLIHFYNNAFTTYGMFRDELYYIACSEHLAFGYVDQPPLCALVLWLSRALFGDSIFAIRIVPSLAHALTVLFAGLISKHLGGRTYAQFLSALLVAFAPGFVGITGIYSMNALEIFLWALTFFLMLKMIESPLPKYWIAIGVVVGLGLMNKISMGWLAAGLLVGIIATPLRLQLKTYATRIAALIAFVIFLPYIIWNIQHDFAHVEFATRAAQLKYSSQNPLTFFSGLVLLYNPLAVPVWIAGFFVLLRHERKEYRSLGYAVAAVLAILLINVHSKSEYFNPAAVALLAAGAVQIERWCSGKLRMAGYLFALFIFLTGCAMMPMAIDILPVKKFVAYAQSIGLRPPNTEGHEMGNLPQHFADRFGWKELAANVASVYSGLTVEEQRKSMIYVQNYGQAGAIDFYGKEYGLPKAIAGHNNYWLWGFDRLDDTVDVLIAVGGSVDDYSDTFAEIVLVKMHTAENTMPYENNRPIYLCRKPRLKIKDVWHTTKNYI